MINSAAIASTVTITTVMTVVMDKEETIIEVGVVLIVVMDKEETIEVGVVLIVVMDKEETIIEVGVVLPLVIVDVVSSSDIMYEVCISIFTASKNGHLD